MNLTINQLLEMKFKDCKPDPNSNAEEVNQKFYMLGFNFALDLVIELLGEETS